MCIPLVSRICLVTSAHIAHNPRIVKEADALTEAGYAVRVVTCQVNPLIAERDTQLVARRYWMHDPVLLLPHTIAGKVANRYTYWRFQVYRRLLAPLIFRFGIAERAFGRTYSELVRQVLKQPADLIIAHNPDALAVAAVAAQRMHAKLGFDSEDFHTGEFVDAEKHTLRARLVKALEQRYLPLCQYVSAPSALIAAQLRTQYTIPEPVVIHNVFPWADREKLDGKIHDRRGSNLSLFWYSQTVGLNRGLQDVIRAAGLLAIPVQIHIRGQCNSEVRTTLSNLAHTCGVDQQVYFHPTVPPDELLSRTAEHDVGLALEPGSSHSQNNELTISNKLFTYMLAGLAIAATATTGQQAVFAVNPAIGALYPSGDYQALALILKHWQDNPAALAQTRAAALEAARTRWNWEYEQQTFVQAIKHVLSLPVSSSAQGQLR